MKTLKIKHKFVLMRPLDIALAIHNRIIVKNFLFSKKKGGEVRQPSRKFTSKNLLTHALMGDYIEVKTMPGYNFWNMISKEIILT